MRVKWRRLNVLRTTSARLKRAMNAVSFWKTLTMSKRAISLSSTKRKKSRQANGYVGILAADIHFPENGSLKDKRQYLRSLKAGLSQKMGASVAEVGFHDLWQRSRLVL